MGTYLTYHRRVRPTGRRLARALGFTHFGVNIPDRSVPSLLLRWGNAARGDAGTTVNRAEAIWKAGDKLASFRALREREISVPLFHESFPNEPGVWLARSRRGFGGRDIQVANGYPVVGAEFYSRYVPNEREYRIHVVCGEVIRVQRKYLERPDWRRSEYIKNHANGYVFEAPSRKLNKSRLDVAVRAVEALGLDFGAVDLVVGEDGLEYVLEVNTAPACSPLTLSAYVAAFKRNFPQIAALSV